MPNPSILLRPNVIFNIFINLLRLMFKKSYWLAVQVKKTTLSYKVLCVKFYDIFKTTICLPVHCTLYFTLLQPMCTKHFVSYPHGNDNTNPGNYVCIVERHF